ncbi:MAG: hypothetical protein A3B04_02565 [Candidatus Portnoybacteria bacterium RIFCSPLOWO2_02_FULL_39_11]|uniref:EamA domain-containing protein n=1 Tax=Candidatus Portnoybacteria bacterium RIFCSPLOWO2_02_FULL_39_11 TaxID=1802001 RepID=A0A1G2FVS3_9BACT|nr:MAG: hypothetical protein A3B04_02565 [Candidatus Portnoybacteria bacterium RIFCSPLOWO2_02_FULL_39_11]
MNKGLLLVFSTAVISGFSVFINKYSVSVINPYIFTFLKNALVALVLCGVVFLFAKWTTLKSLTKKQWLLLLTIGLVGGGIPFLLFFKGLSLTTAAQGAFIHKTMFLFVMILAVVFLKEKITKNFLIGALLLLLGNLIALKTLPVLFGWGDALILLATMLWAIENTISKYVLKDLPGTIIAWGRMFFGSIFILGYLGFTGQINIMSRLTAGQIGWTAITAGLLFAYVMTWYNGLKYVPVSVAAAILLIGSPITTLLTLINAHKIALPDIQSGLLLILGTAFILLSFPRQRESTPHLRGASNTE